MSYQKKSTYYFDAPGPANTHDCAEIASRGPRTFHQEGACREHHGKTAEEFQRVFQGTGVSLVVVTHVVGFSRPGEWEFSREAARRLESSGVTIVTGTHALSGLERAFSRSAKVGGGSRTEAVAEALRRVVSVGLKVAVECTLIAADQGVISPDEEVIAVGGTATGADTVCVIRPAHTSSFFDLQVREIVAMPRDR